MKFFTLIFALSAAFCTCLTSDCAFAQSEPATQQASTNAKDSSQPNVSVIEINSDPWAVVYIDHKRIGNTPVSIAIEPGEHEFELQSPTKHFNVKKTFEVKAGQKASYSYSFKEEFKYEESRIPENLLPGLESQLAQRQSAKVKDADTQNKNAKGARRHSRKKAKDNSNRLKDSRIPVPF